MHPLVTDMRKTIALATPIALGSTSQILMGILDSAMVGRIGTIPLAASALGNSLFSFFYVIGIGLLMPVSVFVSEAHGAGGGSACLHWLRNGLSLALAYSAGCLLLILALSTRLDLLGAPAEVAQEARPFVILIGVSLVPGLLWQCLRQYSESLGSPWLPMVVMALSVLLNAALNWLLIFGNLGCPALGLTGSGWSTLIARVFAVIALLLVLKRQIQGPSRPVMKPSLDRSRLREMLRLGLPSAGQLLFEVGAFSAAAVLMGWLGAEALAAHQIALSCATATFMIPLGLGLASSMLLARAQGAGERTRLRPLALAGLVSAWCFMGLASLLLLLLATPLARLFTAEAPVIAIASSLLIVAAVFQLADGTQVIAACALRGLRDTRVPMLVTGIAYILVAMPASYLLGMHGLGPSGVWWGLAGGLAFAAVFLTRRLLRATALQA